MDLTTFVFQVAAITYLSAGIGALRGKMNFETTVKEFEKSPGLSYVTGFFTLLVGMLLVANHNIWVKDWSVIVTIFGWAAVIKGILFMAFPESLGWFRGWFKNTQSWGVLLVILGLIFSYLGFMM